MAIYDLQYECQLCGEEFIENGSFSNGFELENEILPDFQSWREGKTKSMIPRLVIPHVCDDDRIGIADLIGLVFVSEKWPFKLLKKMAK